MDILMYYIVLIIDLTYHMKLKINVRCFGVLYVSKM